MAVIRCKLIVFQNTPPPRLILVPVIIFPFCRDGDWGLNSILELFMTGMGGL